MKDISSSVFDELDGLLKGIAAKRFAGVEDPSKGESLRSLADGLLATIPDENPFFSQLRAFRKGLNEYEDRGRHDRSRVIAHGLRICLGLRAIFSENVEKKKKAKRSSKAPLKSPPKKAEPSTSETKHEETEKEIAQLFQSLPGVGPKTALRLVEQGLRSFEDIAHVLPVRYEDRRNRVAFEDLRDGEHALIEGRVLRFRQGWFKGRYSATMTVEPVPADFVDDKVDGTPEEKDDDSIEIRWFHPVGGILNRVSTGDSILLAGTAKLFRERWSMVHPEVLDPEEEHGIAIRYPKADGIAAKTLSKICQAAVERVLEENRGEILPTKLMEEFSLPSHGEALSLLHHPSPDVEVKVLQELQASRSSAHRRLAAEEFFLLQMRLLSQRHRWQADGCRQTPIGEGGFSKEVIRACLPFEPTRAQWRVLGELEEDMSRSEPMLRMVQGDVGSGKTVIAFAAARASVEAGGQVAVMAPTEILAEQHAKTLGDWCEKAGIRCALLSGATSKAERRSLLALLSAGEIDVLVGTHALLYDSVEFKKLTLVVVDEQHRFGVEQRAKLRDKGPAPHLLVMTATPIPRSLALTAFGELDVSVIDEMPPGRESPKTEVLLGKGSLERARKRLAACVLRGVKAFVICPLVEASEAIEASDVEASAAAIASLLPEHQIGLVHGRMSQEEKAQVMSAFHSGEVQVLVATTVVEVGVDIPDARAMLVEHAERFGLAQLHQLRGRIGRSGGTSLCMLHSSSASNSDAGQRLEIMRDSADGFAIAEKDLALRGPGEVFGKRQSGLPRFRFADFSSEGMRLLSAARKAAWDLIDEDPNLDGMPTLRRVLDGLAEEELYAGESG